MIAINRFANSNSGFEIYDLDHLGKFESMKAVFDVRGNLYVADKLKEEDKIAVTNYGIFPFAQKWHWQTPGFQHQFNSFDVSKVTGQLLIDTLTELYLIDSAGTGRRIETSCINKGRWFFSPSQKLLQFYWSKNGHIPRRRKTFPGHDSLQRSSTSTWKPVPNAAAE